MALRTSSLLTLVFVVSCFWLASLPSAKGGVLFASLPKTLIVKAQIDGHNATNNTLRYERDNLTVTWWLNQSFAGMDTNYKKVVIKLCFGMRSAVNRAWRKNYPDLQKSKTCKYKIAAQKYHPEGNTTTWQADKDTPGAYYFVRVFVLNSSDPTASPANNAIAFGQTTDKNRTKNLFMVEPYDGRSGSLNIVIIVLSFASYILLFGFFVVERLLKKTK
eukprot:TRINITY_DN809_c0_g1_i1.p1 TRINITY_DN809_c0_g1~~TRINITY_DN809_c0_g1_i1.p1  ORF type:complete len:218 (-),score=41.41 TRINITY_DN809_c0_g1_i1:367-1020(-)